MNNQERLDQIYAHMAEYIAGDAMRIQHFTKVHYYSAMIGRGEGLDDATLYTLEVAAILHDIGIHPALREYGTSAGPYQEKLGPAPARELLEHLGEDENVIDRVCYLIAHHHTYNNIEGIDYQILVEADFLVNLLEDGLDKSTAENAYAKIFKTATGKRLWSQMYGVEYSDEMIKSK